MDRARAFDSWQVSFLGESAETAARMESCCQCRFQLSVSIGDFGRMGRGHSIAGRCLFSANPQKPRQEWAVDRVSRPFLINYFLKLAASSASR